MLQVQSTTSEPTSVRTMGSFLVISMSSLIWVTLSLAGEAAGS